MSFTNSPHAQDGKIRRYVHSPLVSDYNGIRMNIQENGRTILSKSIEGDDEVVFDELEVPASLVFKLLTLIRAKPQSPLVIDHGNIHATINPSGTIALSKSEKAPDNDEVIIDEIEVQTSVIFKLASLLKATRRIEFIDETSK